MRHKTAGSALAIGLVASIAACEPDRITETGVVADPGTEFEEHVPPTVQETAIWTPEGCFVVSYEARDGLGYFEGDIVLGTVEQLSQATSCPAPDEDPDVQFGAVRIIAQKWPGGIVYYEPPTFSATTINRAIARWNASPKLTFVPVPSAPIGPPRIRFVVDPLNPTVGSSALGMQGGVQTIRLGVVAAQSVQLVTHEIGHALGMPHEHTRIDRDAFVTILWPCIQSGRAHNFQASAFNLGLTSYDYRSIMHYGTNTFSIAPGCPTIIPKNGNTIAPSATPTASDYATINAWY